MACSKTENAPSTTPARPPAASASRALNPLAPPVLAARAAWQIGHHWHSGASVGGGSLVAVSHTSPLALRSAPRVRFTWSATWFAMLRAPAFIIQRWKSAMGSLPRDEPRPLPAWPRPPGWPLVLAWPLPGCGPVSWVALLHGSPPRVPLSCGLRSCEPLLCWLLACWPLACWPLLCWPLLCDGLPPLCGALPCGSPLSPGWPSSRDSDT